MSGSASLSDLGTLSPYRYLGEVDAAQSKRVAREQISLV